MSHRMFKVSPWISESDFHSSQGVNKNQVTHTFIILFIGEEGEYMYIR